jgi:hypothetical protein
MYAIAAAYISNARIPVAVSAIKVSAAPAAVGEKTDDRV